MSGYYAPLFISEETEVRERHLLVDSLLIKVNLGPEHGQSDCRAHIL